MVRYQAVSFICLSKIVNIIYIVHGTLDILYTLYCICSSYCLLFYELTSASKLFPQILYPWSNAFSQGNDYEALDVSGSLLQLLLKKCSRQTISIYKYWRKRIHRLPEKRWQNGKKHHEKILRTFCWFCGTRLFVCVFVWSRRPDVSMPISALRRPHIQLYCCSWIIKSVPLLQLHWSVCQQA